MQPASERIARITKLAWIGGSLGAALAFRTARTPAAFWAVTGGGAVLGGYVAVHG
jgi:surfactin synthase thioesterase subunit